jgi:hypothetical protein
VLPAFTKRERQVIVDPPAAATFGGPKRSCPRSDNVVELTAHGVEGEHAVCVRRRQEVGERCGPFTISRPFAFSSSRLPGRTKLWSVCP